jgi:protein SCO1/2
MKFSKSIKNRTSNFLFITYFALTLTGWACSPQERRLPILGEKRTQTQVVAGKEIIDTIYFQIPDFSFVNQDSQAVTPADFKGKIYVADFFFTSCPTICPIMKTQMLRLHEHFKNNANVKILSHTIDPRHDTVALLKDYATRLQVDTKQWNFVTGEKDKIYEIAEKAYFVSAKEDANEAGGFIHSGAFVLVDTQRRIRGYYDGTKADKVDLLMKDMELLLQEDTQN